FVLSSGRRADVYVDLRRVLLDGRLAPLAGRGMLDLTADLGYDAVGGLTLGADPVATAMMHAAAARGTPVDAFVVRKQDQEHGTQRRIEGPELAGRTALAREAPDRGPGGGRAAAARGRGHVHHRGVRAGRCRRAGRGGRGSGWRSRAGRPGRPAGRDRARADLPGRVRASRPRRLGTPFMIMNRN